MTLTLFFSNRSSTETLLIARRRRSETHWREEMTARSDSRQVAKLGYLKIRDCFLVPIPDFFLNSSPFWSFQNTTMAKTTQWQRTSTSYPDYFIQSACVKHRTLMYPQIALSKNKLVCWKVKKVTEHFLCLKWWSRDYLCVILFFFLIVGDLKM